jgi:hypothetical protein
MRALRLSAGLIGLVLVAGASADTIIDTNPANSTISAWGPSTTLQYGQVITVPTTDNVLKSFSFTFNSDTVFNFNADVAGWGGAGLSGRILSSSAQTTADIGSNHTYLIDTGGLALTPGAKYVLFFDAYGGGSGRSTMASRNDDPYGGGAFVYGNNITANLTTGSWFLLSGQDDAVFTADFATVPAPSAVWGGLVLLIGMGIGATMRSDRFYVGFTDARCGVKSYQNRRAF